MLGTSPELGGAVVVSPLGTDQLAAKRLPCQTEVLPINSAEELRRFDVTTLDP